jgi:hypothetical protein
MRPFPTLALALLAAAVSAPWSAPLQAQDKPCFLRGATPEQAAERPSPLGETHIAMGSQHGKVCYGRPKANSRKVMGELVPFGQPWRLGANEATALHLPFAASVGGVALEPGSYSLYAIPGNGEWELVLNRNVERWGVPINEAVRGADVGTFKRPAEATDGVVEQLTFRWESHGETMGHLIMEWENTRIQIPIQKSGM